MSRHGFSMILQRLSFVKKYENIPKLILFDQKAGHGFILKPCPATDIIYQVMLI
ncbi:MAG: hypothetical protein SPL73_04330 [Cyanobacteriota bacterium]|nr:hypothetical protein [Cyanobacteriota bacterium]